MAHPRIRRVLALRRRLVSVLHQAEEGQPDAGGVKTLVALRNLVVDCGGAAHVLQTVLMAYPNQASSLQGSHGVSCDILAVDDLGTGSGWQQSKQNEALFAVVGK